MGAMKGRVIELKESNDCSIAFVKIDEVGGA